MCCAHQLRHTKEMPIRWGCPVRQKQCWCHSRQLCCKTYVSPALLPIAEPSTAPFVRDTPNDMPDRLCTGNSGEIERDLPC
jgi:hypothetical protein